MHYSNIYSLILLFTFYTSYSLAQLPGNIRKEDSCSFVMDYPNMLKYKCDSENDRIDKRRKDSFPLDKIPEIKKKVNPLDDVFIKKIAESKIIILNEDHLFSQNRILWYYFLNKLSAYGYKHLFVEALNSKYVQREGESITQNYLGFYFNSPVLYDIYKLSLENKIKLYAYEQKDSVMYKGHKILKTYNFFDQERISNLGLNISYIEKLKKQVNSKSDIKASMNSRDLTQFLNFYEKYKEIIKEDPNAKVIILVGFGHIKERLLEQPDGDWYTLTYHIKNTLKIDPTTIELSDYADNCGLYKNTMYDNFFSQLSLSEDSFYVIDKNIYKDCNIRLSNYDIYYTDYAIVSPKIKLVNGRESWLLYNGKKFHEIKLKNTQIKNGETIVAYYANTKNNILITADYVRYNHNSDNYFVLFPGKYSIYNFKTKKKIMDIVVE